MKHMVWSKKQRAYLAGYDDREDALVFAARHAFAHRRPVADYEIEVVDPGLDSLGVIDVVCRCSPAMRREG
jgi:hypothetical protein